MHKSKFIQLIKTFSITDLRLFELFIMSPYYNKNEDLILLYKEIKKYAPNYISKMLQQESIFKSAFKNKSYDKKLLGYYSSDLVRLAEKFCTVQQFEKDASYRNLKGLNSFLQRNLAAPFKRYLKEAEKINKTVKFKNANFYYNQYSLEKIRHESFAIQNKRVNNEIIYTAIENLDTFYLSEKLRFSCQILNRKNVISMEYNDILIQQIVAYIEKSEKFAALSVEVYYYIYKGLVEPNNLNHFKKLRQFIDEKIELFEEEEAANIYLYAINYALRKVNSSKPNFEYDLFTLYKNGIVQKKLFTKNTLSPWTFKNMVTISLRVNEFEWVEKFINDYLPFLESRHKEYAYIFNRSKYLYAIKNYDEAQTELNKVAFTDIFYHLDSRLLLAKIYFDKKEGIALNAHLENLKVYVRRHKLISDSNKGYYSKLIGYIKKTYNLNGKDKEAIEQLKDELEKQANISDRKWLLEKIEEKIKR